MLAFVPAILSRRSSSVASVGLLLLAACGKGRPDRLLAEVTSPIHASLRTIEAPVPRTCTGTAAELLRCLSSRDERTGCVYLDIGASADTPERVKEADPKTRCALGGPREDLGQRAILHAKPLDRASLHVDPLAERVVVDVDEAVHLLFLREGRLSDRFKLWGSDGFLSTARPPGLIRPDGTLDWSLIPPQLALLKGSFYGLTVTELDALLARTPGGKAALKKSLIDTTDSAGSMGQSWSAALSRLDPADQAEVRTALLASLAGGSDDTLEWFLAEPERQGAGFLDALEASARIQTWGGYRALAELLRLDPGRAERLACDAVEADWLNANTLTHNPTPFAVIVSRRAKCPWVVPLLEREACSSILRCDPKGATAAPLCNPEQRALALELILKRPYELQEDGPDMSFDDEWGTLLVAAALIQGPLPQSVRLPNERRSYPRKYVFEGDEADDPCHRLARDPSDWACALPLAVRTSTTGGCRLELDDEKKTMTLRPAAKEWRNEE